MNESRMRHFVLLTLMLIQSTPAMAQEARSVLVKNSSSSSGRQTTASAPKHRMILMDDRCQGSPSQSSKNDKGKNELQPIDKNETVIGTDFFAKDNSLSKSSAYRHKPDGTIEMSEMVKGPDFEPHNHNAWALMHEGSNMERRAILEKQRQNIAEYALWHGKACERFSMARAELTQHLQVIHKEKKNLPEFMTYLNLCYCYALAGDSKNAMIEYDKYKKSRESFWTMPYSQFRLAVIFMQHHSTMPLARQLLLETVQGNDSSEPVEWNQYNDDPEYRVISWFLIAEIERAEGQVVASEKSRAKAKLLLQQRHRTASSNQDSSQFVKQTLQRVNNFEV